MRHSNPAINEEGYGLLLPYAADYVPQLIQAFKSDENAQIRGLLMELIGAAQAPAALPFLRACLHDESETVRNWAVDALRQMNTREARTALWQSEIGRDQPQ
jgi:HEAT repeat protein